MNLTTISDSLSANRSFLLVCVIAACLIGVAYYIYITYVVPKMDPNYIANKEFLDKDAAQPGNVEVILFFASWCPLSKKAMPVWEKIKEKYNGKTINNYLITFREIDGSDSENAAVSEKLDDYKVDGFPTIKLLKENELIDFDANPTQSSLEQFITTVVSDSNSSS